MAGALIDCACPPLLPFDQHCERIRIPPPPSKNPNASDGLGIGVLQLNHAHIPPPSLVPHLSWKPRNFSCIVHRISQTDHARSPSPSCITHPPHVFPIPIARCPSPSDPNRSIPASSIPIRCKAKRKKQRKEKRKNETRKKKKKTYPLIPNIPPSHPKTLFNRPPNLLTIFASIFPPCLTSLGS